MPVACMLPREFILEEMAPHHKWYKTVHGLSQKFIVKCSTRFDIKTKLSTIYIS